MERYLHWLFARESELSVFWFMIAIYDGFYLGESKGFVEEL